MEGAGFGDATAKEIVKYLASRMMFVTKKIIRILNEEGLDYLLSYKPKKKNPFKLVSYTKVDNQKQDFTRDHPVHAFLERTPLKQDEVFLRLLRKN